MPLSEQEQRLLEEMERSLYHNDADFVATVGARSARPSYRTIVIGVVVAVVGIATLVTGVVVRLPIVGVLGFAIMFVGVLFAVAPPRRLASSPRPADSGAPRKAASGSFMDGLNDRWDRRSDERGR